MLLVVLLISLVCRVVCYLAGCSGDILDKMSCMMSEFSLTVDVIAEVYLDGVLIL